MAEILKEKDETIAQLEEKVIENESRIEETTEELNLEVDDNNKLHKNVREMNEENGQLHKQVLELSDDELPERLLHLFLKDLAILGINRVTI